MRSHLNLCPVNGCPPASTLLERAYVHTLPEWDLFFKFGTPAFWLYTAPLLSLGGTCGLEPHHGGAVD